MAPSHQFDNRFTWQMSLSADKSKQSDHEEKQTLSGVRHSRHCLLWHAARNVCCATLQPMATVPRSRDCLLCHKADNVCRATQQTTSAVSHSRYWLLYDS